MSTYAVEKGIPMPPAARLAPRHVYPWHVMEIGDSFLVLRPGDVAPNRFVSRISSKASQVGKTMGRVFRCRSTTLGVRVWRVA